MRIEWNRDLRLPAAVFAFALGFRAFLMWDAGDAPFWSVVSLDEKIYLELASRLLEGRPPDHGAYYVTPGYAYGLALIQALGGDILTAKTLNLLAGAVSVVLVALLARRFFGAPAALAAALVWAVYPSKLLQELLLLKASFTALWLLLALVLVTRGRRGESPPNSTAGSVSWGLAGACMGLAILLRGELLIASFVLAGAGIAAKWRNWPGAPASLALALFVGAILIAVAIPTVQNYRHSRDFVVLAYGGGPNFYIGNHPEAHGGYRPLRPERSDPRVEESDAVLLASRAKGRRLGPAAVSAYWWKQGLTWWREQPIQALRLTAKKFAMLWGPQELGDGLSTQLAGRWVWSLRNPIVGPLLVLPLALVGVYLFRKRRDLWTLQAAMFGIVVSLLPFFLFERFRLHLVAIAVIFAAGAAKRAVQAWRQRRFRPLASGVVAWAAAMMVLSLPGVPINDVAQRAHIGTLLSEAGREEEALLEYEAVRRAVPEAWQIDINIATSHAVLRNYEQARIAVERVLNRLHAEAEATGLPRHDDLTYCHELAAEVARVQQRYSDSERHYRSAFGYAPSHDKPRLRERMNAVAKLRQAAETP